MSSTSGQVILAGTVRFPLDKLDAAIAMMIEVVRETRAEDGCVAYSYAQDLADPGLVHIFEVWRDDEALHGHHTAPHFLRWKEDRVPLGMSERKLYRYDVTGVREA